MNSLLKVSIAVLIVACCGLYATAQTIPHSSAVKLDVDYARFRGDENNLFVEIYYAFPQKSLTYKLDTAGFRGGLVSSLSITRGDSTVFQDRWIVPHVVKDTSLLRRDMMLTGISAVGLGAGQYVLRMTGQDMHNLKRRDSVALDIHVRMLDTHKVILSDLEVASVIRPGKKESPFYKNTLEVIPSAGAVFSENKPVYYYVEAYNLLKGLDRSDYTIRTVVLDAIGREVSSSEKVRKRVGESSVIVDNAPTTNLHTGAYTLVMALLDSSRKTLTSAGKKFFVYNPSKGTDSTLQTSAGRSIVNTFAGIEVAELDKECDWLRYESSEMERAQYKQLADVEAKRKFLSDFWGRRGLGAREEFLRRVGYVNATYHTMTRDGYKTDRGRVYLTYGPPNDIDRHPSESESLPYESWAYHDIQGGVVFVFVQKQLGGDYELVHSTHRNELQDDNWIRFVQTER